MEMTDLDSRAEEGENIQTKKPAQRSTVSASRNKRRHTLSKTIKITSPRDQNSLVVGLRSGLIRVPDLSFYSVLCCGHIACRFGLQDGLTCD